MDKMFPRMPKIPIETRRTPFIANIDEVFIILLDYRLEMKNIRCLKKSFGPQEVNLYR